MNREEEIKAAIIVTPEAIAFTSPEMNAASQATAYQLGEFINWLETLGFGLERHELITLAGAILASLPLSFQEDPDSLAAIQDIVEQIKGFRR